MAIRAAKQEETRSCRCIACVPRGGGDDVCRHEACRRTRRPASNLLQSDARNCAGVPDGFANLVVTSPPYPNNFDYADATRLEMSFMGEVRRWADLHQAVRRHLVASCSQHVNEKTVDLGEILSAPELTPIRSQLAEVCGQLAEIGSPKEGKRLSSDDRVLLSRHGPCLAGASSCLYLAVKSLFRHRRFRSLWSIRSGGALVGCVGGGGWL